MINKIDSNKLNPKKINFIENVTVFSVLVTNMLIGQFLSFKILGVQAMNNAGERIILAEMFLNVLLGLLISIAIHIVMLMFSDRYMENLINIFVKIASK